jgi:hypothetical protein
MFFPDKYFEQAFNRLLKYLRQQVFNSLLTQPRMAAPAKQARKRLIRREHIRTCAGRAS